MTQGEVILGIVTAVCTMIITVVGILVRSNVIELKGTVETLRQTVASSHALILSQNTLISSLTAQNSDLEQEVAKSDDTEKFTPDQIYQANPPYRKREPPK